MDQRLQSAAERIAAELRPIRVARYRDLASKVRELGTPEPDLVCAHCLRDYLGKANGEFAPQCELTADIQIRNNPHLQALDSDELNQWWVLNDPVAWAKFELDWEPRWYQIGPLRCSARKRILRTGRQIGKTEVMALLGLFYAVNYPGERVIFLAPYQDQVDLAFERLRALIKRSDNLSDKAFKIRDKMNPHEIEFAHPEGNSTLFGTTTGLRTGQKGDKTRGQTPTKLFVDEMDLLDDETVESFLAALVGAGEKARVAVSSTPTGRRGLFYKWSMNKRLDFKEFHYESRVSPKWGKEVELFYLESYSENAFAHEFLGEFGEMEVGLFAHRFIEASLHEYSLKDCRPGPDEIRTMGVDWNRKGIGVHIFINALNTKTGKIRAVCKDVVDVSEFTQLNAINRIIELNKIWDPQWIYVDEGDGTTQTEALHLHGMQNPETKLHRRVKGVDFGSKIQIRDPLTGGMIKKAVKPLMVDLCVRRLELGQLELPRGEDHEHGLIGQMREFQVVRFGREGQPVYSDDKEHTLVAWMLSIYALCMEYSSISKVTHDNNIFTITNAIQKLVAGDEVREMRDRQTGIRNKTSTKVQDFASLQLLKGNMFNPGVRKQIKDMASRSEFVGRSTWRTSRGSRRD